MSSTKRLRLRIAAVVGAVAALLGGCGRPAEEPPAAAAPAFDPIAEQEVIKAIEREWVERLAADDVDWIVDLHVTDGWQLPPGGELIVGREALRSAWRETAATDGLEITWQPTVVRVSAGGDMAYDLGAATITGADGSVTPAKYLVVWVREGGRWRVAAYMFSPNVGH